MANARQMNSTLLNTALWTAQSKMPISKLAQAGIGITETSFRKK